MKVSITVLGELSALHSDGCCPLSSSMVVNDGCDDGSDDQPVWLILNEGHDQKIENGLVAEKAETEDRDCAWDTPCVVRDMHWSVCQGHG